MLRISKGRRKRKLFLTIMRQRNSRREIKPPAANRLVLPACKPTFLPARLVAAAESLLFRILENNGIFFEPPRAVAA
jgi:hypothetical protein